ncbi:hypothetical protein JQK88_11550 [Mesorhizobium caraganae]|nr:hypothetical protein [Mesorhizobium caraganae]MBM2711879.1 hypothetical protein [Mesorhizobium caraganae]
MKDLIHWLFSVDWLNFAGVFATVIALGLSLHFLATSVSPNHHGDG